MHPKINFFLNILILATASSCGAQNETKLNGLESIDLSSDDKCIVYSFFKNDISEIFIGSADGNSITTLISSVGDTSYIKPKFSPRGTEILFLAFPKDKKSSYLNIVDKNGKNRRQITFGKEVITDAVFSSDGREIYFVKANSFESFSPIGRAAPHEMDIYKIDLETRIESQLTSIKAYGIYNPTIAQSKYLLARIEDDGGIMGIYLVDLSEPNNILPIVPLNNPRGNADMYYDPSYSERYNILAFTAPYELYAMDLIERKAKLVYRPKNEEMSDINNVVVFKTTDKILFKMKNENDGFRVVCFDGSNLQKIKITLKQ